MWSMTSTCFLARSFCRSNVGVALDHDWLAIRAHSIRPVLATRRFLCGSLCFLLASFFRQVRVDTVRASHRRRMAERAQQEKELFVERGVHTKQAAHTHRQSVLVVVSTTFVALMQLTHLPSGPCVQSHLSLPPRKSALSVCCRLVV